MTNFAQEIKPLPLDVAANGSADLPFGPPTAGPVMITVEAWTPALRRAPADGTGPASGGGGLILQSDFTIQIFGPGQTTPSWQGPAPLSFTILPAHRPTEYNAPAMGGTKQYKLRVINTTATRAIGNVYASYTGTRPILETDLDLGALNYLLSRVLAESKPITVALENRTVPLFPLHVSTQHTWLVLIPDTDMQRQFGTHEFDLGAKVIDQRLESEPLRVSLVINDNRLALKSRIDFPFGATFLIKNLVEGLVSNSFLGLGSDIAGKLEELLVGVAEAKIKTLSAEFMFTMRDVSLSALEAPTNTCDIMIRPFIELDGVSGTLTMLLATLVEGFCGRAYDFANPVWGDLAKLRDIAGLIWRGLGHYLLGRDQPDLLSQVVPGGIHLLHAGDDPQQPAAVVHEPVTSGQPLPDPGLLANIQHIVVLMMENRSFDQMLGYLSLPRALGGRGRTDVDGLKGTEWNTTPDGGRAYVFPFTRPRATLFGYDPGHGFEEMATQRGGQTLDVVTPAPLPHIPNYDDPPGNVKQVTVPPMGGFVLAYGAHIAKMYTANELADTSRNYGAASTDIMGYHLPADVGTYDFLAANYMVCDRWFAAHPGNTWPNRFITLTGGLAPKPPHDLHAGLPETGTPSPQDFTPVHVKNIFDYLTAAGVTWRYYEHDMCMLRLFADYTLGHPNIVQIDDPVHGLEAAASAGRLPSVVFIDPDLTDIPAGNDDHPPSDIAPGQVLVSRVYKALRQGQDWGSTLLIVTYDEYGGFFDHVLPRAVSDPTDPNYVSSMFNDPEFPEQAPPGQFHPMPVHYRGPRVPAFIVTPFVTPGSVSHIVFDHASILKTISTRFLHANPPPLGERVDRAHGLQEVLVPASHAVVGPPPVVAVERGSVTAIPPGHFVDDFRTLMSAVRDRNNLHR